MVSSDKTKITRLYERRNGKGTFTAYSSLEIRTAKVQARLRIRAVSPEHMLFAHVRRRAGKISSKELNMWPC